MPRNSTVKPDVIFIDDLLHDIEKGMLKVPAFQRQYVWQHKQVLELFDSIFQGYPIGSILLWETDIKMRNINTFNIKAIKKTNERSCYIIDGQQRLTTLFHCLTNESGKDGIWDVYADLIKGKFLHLGKNEKPKPHYFPIQKVRSTSDFLKECTRLIVEVKSEEIIEKAEDLSNTLRKYKLSLIRMVDGGIEDAIEIFTRLNRTGLEILPFDIINALNYVDEGDSPFIVLQGRMNKLAENSGFFVKEKKEDIFNSDIYLKIVRISSGFQLYGKKDTLKLSKYCKSDMFSQNVDLMYHALSETFQALTKELKVYYLSDLPYTNLFYMVYKYYYSRLDNKLPININKLKYYYYHSAISSLPNGSPSVTEKVLDFFSSDFDFSTLTNKLQKDLTSEERFKNYMFSIENGEFSATSASSKITFNIITNIYLRSNKIEELELYYPPLNLFKDRTTKNRLGNKIFFLQTQNLKKAVIYSEYNPNKTNKEIIETREHDIYKHVNQFLSELKSN